MLYTAYDKEDTVEFYSIPGYNMGVMARNRYLMNGEQKKGG